MDRFALARQVLPMLCSALLGSAAILSSLQADSRIRLSTALEVDYSEGIQLPPLQSWGGGPTDGTADYWDYDDLLWRLDDGRQPPVGSDVVTAADELSLVVPFFDYARKIEFAVDIHDDQDRLIVDSTSVNPAFTTLDLRYPEDFSKEFVQPLGSLPPGDYSVTVRSFEITPDLNSSFDYDQIDFGLFRSDPIGYEIPSGFSLERTDEQLAFQVLPLLGDFNANGMFDADDIDLLSASILRQSEIGSFDLNDDGKLNEVDRTWWVSQVANTAFGDANLDGAFDSGDLVAVFQAGQYEDEIAGNSGWSSGDWTGDGDFDSSDLVLAFGSGAYQQDLQEFAKAVPEPSSVMLIITGTLMVAMTRRRQAAIDSSVPSVPSS